MFEPNPTKRQALLKQALQSRNPAMLDNLSRRGQLQPFLKERDSLLVDVYESLEEQGLHENKKALNSDYWTMVQERNRVSKMAWEQALAAATEFPDPAPPEPTIE